jgi:drug/metabolite transporter (DMT)-like permease
LSGAPRHGTQVAGVAIAAAGAFCFATKGIFAKFLYARGWDFESVLVIRAWCALPVMWAWALWRTGPRALFSPPRSALLGAIGGGFLCYYVGALFNFYALSLIDASVERVLLFAYPSIVVLLYALAYRRWPRPRVLVACGITYVGILMVVTGLDLTILRANLAGAGLVMVCAITFALYYLAGDRWTPRIGSAAFSVYALTTSAVCLLVHHIVTGGFRPLPVDASIVGLMAGLVVFATVFGMLGMSEGVRRLGAQRAALVSTVGPPTTILLGTWLLHERLAPAQWLGVAAIVAGILVLETNRSKAPPIAD